MATILIENQNLVYDDSGAGYPSAWYGYYIDQSTDNDLTFRNNFLSSNNVNGYMLEAGDEGVGTGNNRLDDAIIEGNYFKWNGTPTTSIITHGIFTGYQLGVKVRYNYCDGVPMAIIRKSNGMTDTSGGIVAYNIIKNPKPGVVCKGMNGVKIINNTFYSDLNRTTENGYNRAFIECYYNDSIGISATSENCKVYNNIFYAVDSGTTFITIDEYSTNGFECDYNVYWCENSVNNEPRFNYHGSTYTWTQWRALGYDEHSVIVNPNFHKTDNVLDAHRPYYAFIPERRLDYGINLGLGELLSHGIDYENTWSTEIADGTAKIQIQDSNWQVGAYVLRTGNDIGGDWYLAPWGSDTLGDGSFGNPYFRLSKVWPYLSAGDTVYMRGGEYNYDSRETLSGINGTSDSYINIHNYINETPIIKNDGSFYSSALWGGVIYYTGDYFYWKGIEISDYVQTRTDEMIFGFLTQNSSHNIFERLVIHDCGFGMHIGQMSDDNLILNCDIYNIYDPYSTSSGTPDPYEDGDGFSIGYNNAGTTNTFRGCRAWNCCDDGFDLWRSSGLVILDSCWAFSCGYAPDGVSEGGNGNGFKLGVTGDADPWTGYEEQHLRTIQNCAAFNNRTAGFNQNGAYCIHHFYNNIAYNNGTQGFWMTYPTVTDIPHIVSNNISLNNGTSAAFFSTAILNNNTFLYTGASNPSFPVSASDFVTVTSTGIDGTRQYDGSLPILNFLHLDTGSGLIGVGVDVSLDTDCDGKDWNTTPSLGAFEYVEQLNGYYVAPWGSNSTGNGSFNNPYATLKYAWDQRAAAGVTIYMRGGVYEIDTYTSLGVVSGTLGNTINVYNFPNEQPTIMPSSVWLASTNTNGLYLRSDYVHIKGLEICGFVQRKYASYDDWGGTTSFQLYDSDYCTLENLHCHHGGFGIGLSGNTKGTGNLVLNCDTHDCYDPYTLGYEYGGTDGITIRIDLTPGTTNTVRGCRMWNCSDDGFDGWGNEGLLVWDSCWSFHNGYREDGVTAGGDGNGIKFGPIRTLWESDQHEYNQHLRTLQNCIAAFNRSWGFHENATCCIRWIYNNVAYNNLNGGFAFNNTYIINPIDIVRNNISYGTKSYFFFNSSSVVDHNTKNYDNTINSSYAVTDLDFISLDSSLLETSRQSDGSLPLLTFLHLAEGSDLINTGINVGLLTDGDGKPWHSSTPSLGAFEYPDYIVRPTVITTAVTSITTTTASTGGNVTDDGGSSVISRGVCYNTIGNPTIADDTTSNGTGTGSYTSSLIGLTPDTIYYVRAYAVNAEGTSYGNEVSFETNEVVTIPTVTTTAITDIETTTATSGGNVLSDGNATVTARGVCWNTSTNPTIANNCTTDGSGSGSFISSITGLTVSTHYYVRAYATNSAGTAYGSVVEFDTAAIPVITLLTDNLVAFYKMDDYNTPPVDSVNSYNFDINPGRADYLRIGKKGYAIEYSKSGASHGLIGFRENILPPADVFTIAFWIKFIELPVGENINQQIFWWPYTSHSPAYFLSIYYRGSSDRFNFYFKTNDGGYCETQIQSGTLSKDTWYHIVCIANGIGARANIYCNTTKHTSYTDQLDNILRPPADALYIGYWNTVVEVVEANAIIDDVGIWHRALTEPEVISLYNNGDGLTYPFDGTQESFVHLDTPIILKFGIT